MKCNRRWNTPGIPHSGWSAIWIDDLGDRIGSCEMCDNTIRWVHHVEHPDYGELPVGCLCASKMTGSDAKSRETISKNSGTVVGGGWKKGGG
jgi:DNA helicase-2/ATP-dependent DNA helicase PcrA